PGVGDSEVEQRRQLVVGTIQRNGGVHAADTRVAVQAGAVVSALRSEVLQAHTEAKARLPDRVSHSGIKGDPGGIHVVDAFAYHLEGHAGRNAVGEVTRVRGAHRVEGCGPGDVGDFWICLRLKRNIAKPPIGDGQGDLVRAEALRDTDVIHIDLGDVSHVA